MEQPGVSLTPASGPEHASSSTAGVGLVPGPVWRYEVNGPGRAGLPGTFTPAHGQQVSVAWFPALLTDGEDADHSSLLVGLEAVTDDGVRHRLTDQHGDLVLGTTHGVWWTDQWNLLHLDLASLAGRRITLDLVTDSASRGHGWVQVIGLRDRPIEPVDPVERVRTTRGSHNHAGTSLSRGNTFPLTCVPHGFNFLTPITDARSSRWLYAWHGDARDPDPRPRLQALAFCHQPSPWIADRFAFQLMPWAGRPDPDVVARQRRFTHDDELDQPHHYRVGLEDGTVAEMTPTSHAGVFRFTAAHPEQPHGVVLDQPFSGDVQVHPLPDGRLAFSGHVEATHEWLRGPYPALQAYVYGETRQPARADRATTREGLPELPTNLGRWLTRHWPRWARWPVRRSQTWVLTATDDSPTFEVAVAMSFISTSQARRNLELEVGGSSFDDVRTRAHDVWRDVVDRLEIDGGTPDQRTTAWSNLARLHAWPNEHHENVGTAGHPEWVHASPWRPLRRPHRRHHTGAQVVPGQLHVNNGYWDTYRTCWPAYHLLTPRRASTLLEGQLQHFREGGWMPRWSAPGPLDCMVGTSSDAIFADAAAHGLRFDELTAYDSALRNATTPSEHDVVGRKGIGRGRFLGWIDTDTDEGFSWSMENATCDASLARWSADLAERADELGVPQRRAEFAANAAWFGQRGLAWGALFDERVGFLQGRHPDGSFRVPPERYDPRTWGTDYTETNGWGMAFHTPQDGAGLADRHGGEPALAALLEQALATPETAAASTSGHYPAGMHERLEARAVRLGQVAMSNQPAHHTPFMWTFTGQHHRTQWATREILHRLFVGSDIGQGYPGDEDNGEMSAWWLFAALGLYPLHLGSGELVVTAPLFPRMAFRRDNDLLLEVRTSTPADRTLADCRYIQSVQVNGEPWDEVTIPLSLLEDDLRLDVELGPEPSAWAAHSRPASLSRWHGGHGAAPRRWYPDLTLGARVERHDASGSLVETGLTDDGGNLESWERGEQLVLSWDHPIEAHLLTLTTEDLSAPELLVDVRDGQGSWEAVHVGWRRASWPNQTQAYLVTIPGTTSVRLRATAPVRLRQLELY